MNPQRILDEEGETIFSSMYQVSSFIKPYILFDVLKKKEKKPIIKTSNNIDILKEIDFVLYAKPIPKKQAWAKKQKYIIYLRPSESPTEEDFKKLNKLPANHFLEIDIANSKIRLIGSFVKEEDWLYY